MVPDQANPALPLSENSLLQATIERRQIPPDREISDKPFHDMVFLLQIDDRCMTIP